HQQGHDGHAPARGGGPGDRIVVGRRFIGERRAVSTNGFDSPNPELDAQIVEALRKGIDATPPAALPAFGSVLAAFAAGGGIAGGGGAAGGGAAGGGAAGGGAAGGGAAGGS